MPNWCINKLVVTGQEATIDKFIDSVTGEDGKVTILESLIPMPDEMLSGERWYDWRIEHYGCKWPEGDHKDVVRTPGHARFEFATPWSPPIAGFNTIAAMFPDLKFSLRYYECGMGFKGHAEWKDAVQVRNDHGAYHGPLGG